MEPEADPVRCLLLGDGTDGADALAGTAADAGVSVDDVVLVTGGDSIHGALCSAGAAGNTAVIDNVCHLIFLQNQNAPDRQSLRV